LRRSSYRRVPGQRQLEAKEIPAEKAICDDSDDETQEGLHEKPTIDRRYLSELDPEDVEDEQKAILQSEQIKAGLVEFVVQAVKKE
jgi:hypothetical protein